MNVKQLAQYNPNIKWGQAEDFSVYEIIENGEARYIQCSKKKRIQITPIYKVHKTKGDEVYYHVELQKYVPMVVGTDCGDYQSITEEVFNVSGSEMTKFMSFLTETFALEKMPVYSVVSVDKKRALREMLRKYYSDKSLFESLSMVDLDTINGNVTLQSLKNIRSDMEANMDSGGEREYWHPFLKKYNWILSQLFIAPYILFEDEFYVGGKRYDRKGGTSTDFGAKNIQTGNCAIIEIKDAKQPIISSYRQQEYRISDELAGGISQVLKQKDLLYKEYWGNARYEDGALMFKASNIKSILIIGKTPKEYGEVEAFEMFRNELRGVEIITFDELLAKIDLQIAIIEGNLF